MNSLLASPCFVVAFAFANFDTLYTVFICNYIYIFFEPWSKNSNGLIPDAATEKTKAKQSDVWNLKLFDLYSSESWITQLSWVAVS
jgi:hypothetical protein